jgi:glycosyltransferase involved in cell wall biosynthesis
VARFDPGGNKKQLDLARAFFRLKNAYPEITRDWRLVMIGGSTKNNPYLDRIETYLREKKLKDCEIRVNISESELKDYYSRARIFWHLCGLGQKDPAKVEHFGMTIGESMQNRVIPLVFDGGGQREIVENGREGYRVSSGFELIQHTVRLIRDPGKMKDLSQKAYDKSRSFTRERFISRIRSVFGEISAGLKE